MAPERRRSYLRGGMSLLTGITFASCLGVQSEEETAGSKGSSTSGSSTSTDVQTSSTASSSTKTDKPSVSTNSPSTKVKSTQESICLETVGFDTLSEDAQKEFTTALQKGRLMKQYSDFHINKEVIGVDDQLGNETCIQYEGTRYYAVLVGEQNEKWTLTVLQEDEEYVGGG